MYPGKPSDLELSKTQSVDIVFQKVEQPLLKGIVPIVSCIEIITKDNKNDPKFLILTRWPQLVMQTMN